LNVRTDIDDLVPFNFILSPGGGTAHCSGDTPPLFCGSKPVHIKLELLQVPPPPGPHATPRASQLHS